MKKRHRHWKLWKSWMWWNPVRDLAISRPWTAICWRISWIPDSLRNWSIWILKWRICCIRHMHWIRVIMVRWSVASVNTKFRLLICSCSFMIRKKAATSHWTMIWKKLWRMLIPRSVLRKISCWAKTIPDLFWNWMFLMREKRPQQHWIRSVIPWQSSII